MLDILDKLYSISSTNLVVRLLKYAIRIAANMHVRFFMRTPKIKKRELDDETLIVSFTSFPGRIDKVYMVAKTLLIQKGVDNYKVVLWLSKKQFPNGMESVPASLRNLCSKGFDIQFVEEDLKPHKKYYYAFRKYPNNVVITVDDDVLYPSTLVKKLYDVHSKYPNMVIYNRGAIITRDAYDTWETVKEKMTTRCDVLPTGVGGVLYPPHCYDDKIFDADAIKSTCLNTDDLWLSAMCRIKGTMSVYTGIKYGLVNTLSSQKEALCKINCGGGWELLGYQ